MPPCPSLAVPIPCMYERGSTAAARARLGPFAAASAAADTQTDTPSIAATAKAVRMLPLIRCSLDSHGLGQIAGLVDIGAPHTSRMIGEQLQWHDMQYRRQRPVMRGQPDHVDAFAGVDRRVLVDECIQLAAA